MEDNIVQISNTPIFDQLARELHYNQMVARGQVGSAFDRLVPVRGASAWSGRQMGNADLHIAPNAWIAKPVPRMSSEEVRVSETINPEKAEEEYGSFQGFIRHLSEEFNKKYPNAGEVTVTTSSQLDGNQSVTVSGLNPGILSGKAVSQATSLQPVQRVHPTTLFEKKTGLSMDEENSAGALLDKSGNLVPEFVDDATRSFREAHPNAVITGMTPKGNPDGTMTMVIEAIEPQTGYVPMHIAARQLDAYQSAAAAKKDGEIVDSNPNIETIPMTIVPRPLWISDEEIDEE